MFAKRGIVRLAASGGWIVIGKRLRRSCDWLAVAWRLGTPMSWLGEMVGSGLRLPRGGSPSVCGAWAEIESIRVI